MARSTVTVAHIRNLWEGYEVEHMKAKDDPSSDSESETTWVVIVRKPDIGWPFPIMAKYEATEDGTIIDLIYKKDMTFEEAKLFREALDDGLLLKFKNDWE